MFKFYFISFRLPAGAGHTIPTAFVIVKMEFIFVRTNFRISHGNNFLPFPLATLSASTSFHSLCLSLSITGCCHSYIWIVICFNPALASFPVSNPFWITKIHFNTFDCLMTIMMMMHWGICDRNKSIFRVVHLNGTYAFFRFIIFVHEPWCIWQLRNFLQHSFTCHCLLAVIKNVVFICCDNDDDIFFALWWIVSVTVCVSNPHRNNEFQR